MQLAATTARAASAATGAVLASQTIDMRATALPHDNVSVWSTEREFRLAGARDGIATFTSATDAIRAASQLSAGAMPGLAVVEWRGGYRVHDVHATSRTYWSNSPHGPFPPVTRETSRSSVPFAAGNLRPDGNAHTPAVARSEALVALVDGARVFTPSTDRWAGRPKLVEGTVA